MKNLYNWAKVQWCWKKFEEKPFGRSNFNLDKNLSESQDKETICGPKIELKYLICPCAVMLKEMWGKTFWKKQL